MVDPDALRRLAADRTETAARLAAMNRELARVADAVAGSNLDDEHDPEGATIAFERAQFAAAKAQAEEHLADIDAAISRLQANRYGTCERCGASIGDERLQALPATRLCIRCAARRGR
jgi:RNA polymerase-binding transcription factor DksA